MFRNTGANAFAKNQTRLAYEDKRDLYCIYALNMSKHVSAHKHMMLLYNSLVQPYIQYSILIRGNAYQKHLRRLEVAQNNAVRAITRAKYNDATSPYTNLCLF